MGVKTITGLVAVTAGNLTDAALLAVDDANSQTRKATVAQLRTQIFTGSLPTATFGAAVTVSTGGVSLTAGNLTLSDGVVTITDTTAPQLTVRYDASNHMQVSVSSAGAVTFNATGASAGFTFSDAVTVSGTLTADSVVASGQSTFTNGAAWALGVLDGLGNYGRLQASTGGLTLSSNEEIQLGLTPVIRVDEGSSALGFFDTVPIAKPTVSGSRGGNAALADLLTELANLGLITDSTS